MDGSVQVGALNLKGHGLLQSSSGQSLIIGHCFGKFAFGKEAGEKFRTAELLITERTEHNVFINMLWFPRKLFLEHTHPLPSLRTSVGLQIALGRSTQHQEAEVIPNGFTHCPPFLPAFM